MNQERTTIGPRGPSIFCIYLTANAEFIVVDGLCALVRDRATGGMLDDHYALHERVTVTGQGRNARLCTRTLGNRIHSATIESTRSLSAADGALTRLADLPPAHPFEAA
ncbi:MAG: hypothetical protein OXU20_12215 [Myxococcales bacterium]|nr:hypothetical protein [Myxococcales bacterium]